MAMSGYVVHGVEGDSSGLCRSYAADSRCTCGGEGGNLARYFPPWTVIREQWSAMTHLSISGVAIDTLLFSRTGSLLFHLYRIISRLSGGRTCDNYMHFWRCWIQQRYVGDIADTPKNLRQRTSVRICGA